MRVAAILEPRRHEPPEDWPAEVFERLTDALAAALTASWRRAEGAGQGEAGVTAGQALKNIAARQSGEST